MNYPSTGHLKLLHALRKACVPPPPPGPSLLKGSFIGRIVIGKVCLSAVYCVTMVRWRTISCSQRWCSTYFSSATLQVDVIPTPDAWQSLFGSAWVRGKPCFILQQYTLPPCTDVTLQMYPRKTSHKFSTLCLQHQLFHNDSRKIWCYSFCSQELRPFNYPFSNAPARLLRSYIVPLLGRVPCGMHPFAW